MQIEILLGKKNSDDDDSAGKEAAHEATEADAKKWCGRDSIPLLVVVAVM